MSKNRVGKVENVNQASQKLEEALEEFLFWKQAQGISSKTTLKDYERHANMFFKRSQIAGNRKL